MPKNRCSVDVLGFRFTIQSDKDPRYLSEVVDYLKWKVEEARRGQQAQEPVKIALLAALNLVDELFQEREREPSVRNQDSLEIERITEQLIHRIDDSLIGK